MSERRFTTRRKGDRTEPAPPPAPRAPEAAPTRRPEPEPEPARERGPRLDADDLRALADMDPAEIAALMDGASHRVRLSEGDRVEGRVTRIGKEFVFVDVAGKSEASIDRAEVPDARVGEEIVAYVLSVGEDGVVLGRHLSGQAADTFLDTAKESGMPVEGTVTSRNAGGFEVAIGSARAFCPVSQIDRHPGEDLDQWIGRTLRFNVVKLGSAERGRRDVVVSRRAIQEAELEATRRTFWDTVRVGDLHQGTVSGSKAFGVFVDLGPAEGLVPRSEIGEDAPAPGAAFEVRITAIDKDQRKLTLAPATRKPARIEGPGDTGSLGTLADLLGGLRIPPGRPKR